MKPQLSTLRSNANSKAYFKTLSIFFLLWFLLGNYSLFAQAYPISGTSNVCEGDVENYSATASGHNYIWTVSSGNTYISNNNSVTVSWGLAGGVDYVKLIVDSSGVILSQDSFPVNIHQNPEPIITSSFDSDCIPPDDRKDLPVDDTLSNCQTVCEGMAVEYTTPLVTGDTFQWIASGNFTSISGQSTNQATVVWGSPGQGMIVVIQTSPNGCVTSDTICVNIVSKPTSMFHVNQAAGPIYASNNSSSIPAISICMGDQVCFNEDVTGGNSYFWDFGTGNTSQAANPCETFLSAGSYVVMLIAENECHCQDTSYISVDVQELPGPKIECTNVMCNNGTFDYSVIMPNGPCPNGNYNWSVSGNGMIVGANGSPILPTNNHVGIGVTTITVDWSSGPIGTISLSVQGCNGVCDQITSVDIPIIPQSLDIEGGTIVCVGEVAYFNVPCFPGTTYKWFIDNVDIGEHGHELWYTFPSTGVYDIHVEYENEYLSCNGVSDILQVQVLEPFEIGGLDQICEGTSTLISGPSSSNLNWGIKDNSGNFLTGAGTSQVGGSSFTFPSSVVPGSYTVIAFDTISPVYCNEYAIHSINVIPTPPAPTVLNGSNQICEGESYLYTSSPSSNNYYLKWEVYNNSGPVVSNGNSVNVTWGSGTKWIKLYQISKENDCESSPLLLNVTTKTLSAVTVNGNSTACANTATGSPEIYSATPGNFDDYTWSISPSTFGSIVNGQGSNQIQVLWNNVSGNATVSVIPKVCSSTGSAANLTVSITSPPPITISGPDTVCQSAVETWTISAASNVTWEINNALNGNQVATGSGAPINYSFGQAGSFNLVVSGNVGTCNGLSTATKTIVVNSKPVANLTYTGNINCISQNSVNLSVSVQGAAPYTYAWYQDATNFYTGSANTQLIGPGALFTGAYRVVITDANGCTSSSNIVNVRDNCSGGSGSGGCNPVPGHYEFDTIPSIVSPCTNVDFNAVPFGGVPPASSYTWQMANLASLSGQNVNFNFPASGVYPISLVTTYGLGDCNKIFTQDILVPLQADMNINISCSGTSLVVDLESTTDVYSGPLSSWSHDWTVFHNGSQVGPSYTGVNVSNVSGLISGNTYIIRLRVYKTITWSGQTFLAECEIDVPFTMPYPAAASFSATPALDVCVGNPVSFFDTSLGDIVSWDWDFGDLSGITTQNPEKTYETAGTYYVTLTVTDEYGCTNTSSPYTIIVHPNNLTGSFSGIPTAPLCPNSSPVNISITASGSSGYSYNWSTGSTTNSISTNQSSNNYVTVTDQYGCKKSFGPAIVEVDEIPVPFIQGENIVCLGENVELSANYGPNYNYQWFKNGNAMTGETGTTLSVAEAVGTYTYTLELTSATPCTEESVPFVVDVKALPPIPTISVNPSPACPSIPVTLTVTNASNYSLINWTNGSSGSQMTTTTPGIYYAVGTDQFGCKSQASEEVFELPDFCGFMCGCYEDCIEEGDTFYFPGISGTYLYWEWQQNILGSWNTIANQTGSGTVSPFYATTPGNYSIRLFVTTLDGCSGESCEADIDLTICGGDTIPEEDCEGLALMEHIDCFVDENGIVNYNFSMFVDFNPPGNPCSYYTYTVITPSGSVYNLNPGQINVGPNFISGIWNTGLSYHPNQQVCFTVIVYDPCTEKECKFELCFTVPECGEDTSEIDPCDGSVDLGAVNCFVNQNNEVTFNLPFNVNFFDYSGCTQFNTTIVPQFGTTMGISWSNITGTGSYPYTIHWNTQQSFIAAGTYCFDIIITNTCDESECVFHVCFYTDGCGEINTERRSNKSIDEQVVNSEIAIYPNPVQEELKVLLPTDDEYTLEIYNLNGQLVHQKIVPSLNNRLVPINTADFEAGVYAIKCYNSHFSKTLKFVVKK